MLTWPNKALISRDCVIKLEFAEPEAFSCKTLVVCRVAKVTLRTSCCIFDKSRSIFLFARVKLVPYFGVDLCAFDVYTVFRSLNMFI